MTDLETCPRCLGEGDYEGDDCRTCGGTGTRVRRPAPILPSTQEKP